MSGRENAGERIRALVESAYAALNSGRFTQAEVECRHVLAADPGNAPATFILGELAYKAHRYEEAEALLRRAVRRNRHNVEAHSTLALSLLALGRQAEALAAMRRALALRPDLAAVHCNLGLIQKHMCRLDEALRSFERAIALDPGYSAAYFGRALARLLQGETRSAWSDYEWRIPFGQNRPGYVSDPRAPGVQAPFPSSLLPLTLAGRRVLALGEQGIGDDLFFLRYAPALKARGAWLAFLGSPKLAPVLERVAAIDAVVSAEALPHPLDHVVAVGDLPLIATAAGEPAAPPPLPLAPRAQDEAAARERLAAAGAPPYLGVTWRAGLELKAGEQQVLRKELPLQALARSVAGWPGTIVVLQRHPRPGEIETFSHAAGASAADFSGANDDLEQMLGVLSAIDEYAGVSNTNMHLRAGIGRAARVLIPLPPEWRWTAAGATSPWFPGYTLYREDAKDGWSRSLERLRRDLAI